MKRTKYKLPTHGELKHINIDLNKKPRRILYENIIAHSTVLYKKKFK